MRDHWYVPGLMLCLVIAALSIFLSLRMRDGVSSAAWGEYVRWKLLLGDVVFLPVLMIVLGRYRMLMELEEGNRVVEPIYGPAAGALIEAYRVAGLSIQLKDVPVEK